MHYLIEPKDGIFVKGYGFLSFAKNIGKNLSKIISINLSGKYGQKLLDHTAVKTALKKAFKKSAEVMGYLIGDKVIADKITKASKCTP